MFAIEKEIPIPAVQRKNHRWPFAQMEVGDSFVTSLQSVRNAAHAYGVRNQQFFAVRKIGNEFRCWRTK